MKTTCLRNLLLAVVCLFTGVSAQAQFSGGVEQYPTNDWSGSPISFPMAEVAAALGTEAATLSEALEAYIGAEGTPDPILFYVQDAEGDIPYTDATAAANHGFWLDQNGLPLAYGEGCWFYVSPSVDDDGATLTFNLGQMPDVMQVGNVGHTTLKLKLNDKEATFTLKLSVVGKPDFDVPEPTIIEKDLQIVGGQEVTVKQFPRGDYSSDAVHVNIAEAINLLGIDNKAGMAENVEKVLYTTWYNDGELELGGGMKKDSLTNQSTAGEPGFWFRAVQNAEGVEDGEVSAFGWNDADKFFIERFAYNAENDTLTGYLGQYPGTCKENETWFAYIYLVYGQKAYRIKYTLKLEEKTQGSGLADYTKVGEETAIVEQEPTTGYEALSVKPDLDVIAAALGCEVSAIGMIALDDKDNFASSTANNGGFWFSDGGTVIAYGSSAAFFIEPAKSGDYSDLHVGQYPNHFKVGDECSANLYFVNGTNYYQYTVTLKVVEPQKQEYQFESVTTRTFAVQQLLDNSYTMFDLGTVNVEDIESLIGTTSPVLYGLNIDSVAVVRGDYSKAWSCDPNPGFWLNKEGRVSTWGDANSIMGIVYADGLFRGCQKPNLPAVGDEFATQLFLVNEDNNKMITVNIKIAFVESLEQKEVVGSEDIVLPLTDEDEIPVEIDLAKAAEALGTTVDDLLDNSNYCLRGMTSGGVYGKGQNCENGLSFAPDGGYDDHANIYFYIQKAGDKVMLMIYSQDPVAEDFSLDVQFCFEKDAKQYVYYAKLVSTQIYAGINALKVSDLKDATIYDLSGRRVERPVRGLYLQKGRKFIVK